MNNRTYRYFKGQAQYGFGYGLSYTSFQYGDLKLPAKLSKAMNVSVRVRNTGNRDGEEVVQLYVSGNDKNAPLRALKGFQRIFLKKGESKTVSFTLAPEDLSLMGDNGVPKMFRGKVQIAVGGSQPDATTVKSGKTVQGFIHL